MHIYKYIDRERRKEKERNEERPETIGGGRRNNERSELEPALSLDLPPPLFLPLSLCSSFSHTHVYTHDTYTRSRKHVQAYTRFSSNIFLLPRPPLLLHPPLLLSRFAGRFKWPSAFLAITIVTRWISRLVGESLTLRLATATRDQGWIVVQGLAHLVAYDVHQLLEHRLRTVDQTVWLGLSRTWADQWFGNF